VETHFTDARLNGRGRGFFGKEAKSMDEITQHDVSPWWWLVVIILPLATTAAMHWVAWK